jgi:biopolymer transport protein ExbD
MRIEPLARPHRGLRLAPLVDVVFLLLIFFMLVARLDRPSSITVEPPSETGDSALQGAVLVRLGAEGRLDLNGRAVDVDNLANAIAPFLARDPKPRIVVQSAYDVPLQALVQVLDRLKIAGAEDLTLVEP